MLKVSIITASFNNASTVESTLKSVFSQDYPNVEYIIIDGASTDGTTDIIAKYKDKLSVFVSEKDEGIYHALNKGLAKATGDIVGFLHADDFYPANDVISKIVKVFEINNCDCSYGDLQYVERQHPEKVFRNWKSEPYYDGIFLKGFMPPHPTFFMKRKCYEQFGSYNTTFSISADYELMLRMLHKHKLKVHYIPEVLVQMRIGGESNKSLSNRIKANMEDRQAWKTNSVKPSFLTLIRKPLGKLGQFFG
jgi:glycosyltransferase involved in cell wall biosynthesis